MANGEVKLSHPIEKYFNVLKRYQIYFFVIIYSSKLPMFWHLVSILFLSPKIDYYCNETLAVNPEANIKNYCPCKKPNWDKSVFTETIQSKFNLHCGKKWQVSFSQSMIYVGTLIGALTFGFWSDKFGRRSACTWSCLLLGAAGCLVIVMPTSESFIFARCIEGIAAGGYIVASYVFMVEHCGANNREVISALFHIPINCGHLTMAGISYLLRHCDHFQLAISLPMLIFVLMRWLTHDSPKWLLDKGYTEEASKVMEKICKFNKMESETIKAEIVAYQAHKDKSPQPKMKFFHIFRYKRLTLNFICMAANYFVCGMGYYGVSQYIGHMSGDIHLNVGISGAVLIPGTLVATVLLKKLDRRISLMGTNFLSGIFMIIVINIPDSMKSLRVGLACICNCFFFMSFIIAFLFGVELFPTNLRNSALGALSFISRVGQIVAPPINSLSQFIAGLIFGILAIVGGLLCYPLPETKNTELPSSLQDSHNLNKPKTNTATDAGTSK